MTKEQYTNQPKTVCPSCHKLVSITPNGKIRSHKVMRVGRNGTYQGHCFGSGRSWDDNGKRYPR